MSEPCVSSLAPAVGRPLRVGVVVAEFPSLSETFVLSQITGLLDRGHEVDIYAETPGKVTETHASVREYGLAQRTLYLPPSPAPRLVTRLRSRKGPSTVEDGGRRPTVFWNRVKDRLRTEVQLRSWRSSFAETVQYDVLHCHFGGNGRKALALRRAGLLDGRVVTTFHANDVSAYVREFGPTVYSRLFREGQLFLAVSQYTRARLIDLGCPQERILVHRMGIDCGRIRFRPRRRAENGPVRLLTVARLVEKKGVAYALRAVAALIAQGHDLEYQIVGDGPLRLELERESYQLGIRERVTFRGPLTQEGVAEALGDAALFVLPSVTAANGDEEGIPVSLMEAMASGLPVVATDYAGIPELVEDGVSGALVPERDVDQLTARLADLLTRPDRWPAMGRRGRERVERDYDIHALNDRLVELFSAMVGPREQRR